MNLSDIDRRGFLKQLASGLFVAAAPKVLRPRGLKVFRMGTTLVRPRHFYSRRSGRWSDPATWAGGEVPTRHAIVHIDHRLALDHDLTLSTVISKEGLWTFTPPEDRHVTITHNAFLNEGDAIVAKAIATFEEQVGVPGSDWPYSLV